jgi:hypothetical protein
MAHKSSTCNMTRSLPPASRNAISIATLRAASSTIAPALRRVSRRCATVTRSLFGSSTGLGRNLRHLVNVVHDLTLRNIGFRVLTGQGASIDTTTPSGELVFGIFASLAEFERDLISERTRAGLASARARGRKGGRKPKMTAAKVRLAAAAMGKPETNVARLCDELGISSQTLYRYVSPTGGLRADARRILRA